MAAGDQSGTWGDTTNTNLGTLIEEAIAGFVNITMTDANHTLTTNNGATDQARKMVIKLSGGSLTATRDIIVPPKEKFYVVHNATTGGQSIQVKTLSGTGVTIANGDKSIVYCDATNVVNILPDTALSVLNGSTTTGNVLSYNGSAWASSTTLSTIPAGTTNDVLAYNGSAWVSTNPRTNSIAFTPGMIIMWNGAIANIPTGWGLCDGTTYAGPPDIVSPDLTDKFVIGADQDDSGTAKTNVEGSLTQTGGTKDATLVEHRHSLQMIESTNGSFYGYFPRSIRQGDNPTTFRTSGTSAQLPPSNNSAVTYSGTSATNKNLPPYYALAYIIKKPL
jgi:microcystin-dependent protein